MASKAVKTLALVGLLATGASAPGVWAHGGGAGGYGSGYGYGMYPGMMGGYGMMHAPGMMEQEDMMYGPGMMSMGPVWMLDLTDEQQAEIRQLRSELRKKHCAVMAQVMDEREKLFELYSADSPDAKEVAAVYGKISALQGQMIEAAIDTRNRAQAVLTQEQRAQLEQWRHGWRSGPGGLGMMGPGMMGPGMMGPGMMGSGMMGPGLPRGQGG